MSAAAGLGPRLAEAGRVLRFELWDQLTGLRAAVFLVVYALWAGGVGRVVLAVDAQTGGQLTAATAQLSALPEAERASLVEQLGQVPLFGSFFTQALLSQDIPPIVMMVLYGSTAALPLFILLIGHDRIAEDVASRYTRYVLQRVHRSAYLAGKLVALWGVSLVLVVSAQALILGAAALSDSLPVSALLPSMPQVWLATAALCFAYAAYTVLISAVVNHPVSALLLGLFGLFALRSATWMASFFWPPAAQLWMGRWDLPLFHLQPAAVGVFLLYGLGASALAWWALNRRDL